MSARALLIGFTSNINKKVLTRIDVKFERKCTENHAFWVEEKPLHSQKNDIFDALVTP